MCSYVKVCVFVWMFIQLHRHCSIHSIARKLFNSSVWMSVVDTEDDPSDDDADSTTANKELSSMAISSPREPDFPSAHAHAWMQPNHEARVDESITERAHRELDDEASATLAEMVRSLDALGEHEQARTVERRLYRRMRTKTSVNPAIQYFLRCQAIQRQQIENTRRSEARRHDEEMARVKADTKLTKVQAELAKADHARVDKEFKLAKLNEALAAAQRKKEIVDAAQRDVLVRSRLATALAERLSAIPPDQVKSLKKYARYLDEHPAKIPALDCPVRMERDGKVPLFNIAIHVAGKPKPSPIYATDFFARKLFDGKRPQDVPAATADAIGRLRKLVDKCCPGYAYFAPTEYVACSMLAASNRIIDLAFLRMVWLYSASVTSKRFPNGLFAWPPDDWKALCDSITPKTSTTFEHAPRHVRGAPLPPSSSWERPVASSHVGSSLASRWADDEQL